ncbi:HvfC/BufC family peptide modification chaperone [Chitinimonas sp. PSY-7]|uniref:HvfC/BufC family peptide modification chaperone n=1 Tax=Chitinimonas sp. PSY-7 TaxID=3459088 RepID=UPI0040402425
MNLDDLQNRFIAATHDATLADDLFGQYARGATAYANNTLFNRADALAEAYPVVLQLVGDEFFGGMARAYARLTPSLSGDMNVYGNSFPAFIASFEPAQDLPYLADAARLDWYCHLAYYAADCEMLRFDALAAVLGEQQAHLNFVLAPAVSLLRSPWPVASLWRAHQPLEQDAANAFPSPDQGGELVLVWRNARNRVQVRRLLPAEFAFLNACQQALPLPEALERALDEDMEFDFGLSLQRWVTDQVIVDFQLDSKS